MALCLTDCRQVLGISEITKLAWGKTDDDVDVTNERRREDGVIQIHGVSSERITSFFSRKEIGLNAQLQTTGDDQQQRFVKHAIRSYVANRIPLMAILSISRMQGWHTHGGKAIIELNNFKLDDTDRSCLPIGLQDRRFEKLGVVQKSDHHCVVIVGASENEVCLNDPATFPFLESSYEQLIDARAYKPRKGDLIETTGLKTMNGKAFLTINRKTHSKAIVA